MGKSIVPAGYILTNALEFFAVDHCNLKCEGCSQSSPFLKKRLADISVFESNLSTLSKYLRPKMLRILGGEPLLHPEIDAIIKIAGNSGMFETIQITTNGHNLLKMSAKFWRGIDILKISKYPANAAFIHKIQAGIAYICKTNNISLQIMEMNYFKRIILTEEIKNKKVVRQIFNNCIYKEHCHALSEGKFYRCSPVVNICKYLTATGNDCSIGNADYLPISDSGDFKENLLRYLHSENPMDGCKFCLGSSGKLFPHEQISKDRLINPRKYAISAENYFALENEM